MRRPCEEGASVVEVWIDASVVSIKGWCLSRDELKAFFVEQHKNLDFCLMKKELLCLYYTYEVH